ncbi:MAG: UvrD-helicase domain-containing protein [Endomicrobiia bacterium]
MNKKYLPQIFVVEASAGSGKTYSLAKQYLKLLFNFSSKTTPCLKNILAITFTNKAAIEMKNRILELLNKLAFDNFNNIEEKNDLLNYLAIDEPSAQEKAFFLLDYIISNYSFFQVKTIDSFINSLLYSCAFNLNLSSSFKIEDTYIDYLKYSLDELIEKGLYEPDIQELFKKFLKQYLYLNTNISWFPKKNIFDIIKELFYLHNIFYDKFEKSNYSESDIIQLKKKILKQIKVLYNNLPEETNKNFKNSLTTFLQKNIVQFDFSSLSKFFQKENLPSTKNGSVPKKILFLWKKIRKNLCLLAESESSSMLNPYIEIFENLLPEFYSLAQKKDVLFLEELNKYAKNLFSEEQISIPELYYRLATQIKHYLIDEFQDTSNLQWQNLVPIISEAISTGGTMFYVGDKKQSLYRFRGGNIDLFDNVKTIFSNYPIEETVLTNNYRSAETIVKFNNQLFSQKNLSKTISEIYKTVAEDKNITFVEQDISDVVSFYTQSQQNFNPAKQKGYLKIDFIQEDKTTDQETLLKNKLLSTISDLQSRCCNLNNIAILTQRNSEVETVTQWLLEKKFPVVSEKTLDIRTNSIVKEIIAFLKFLNSPSDNLSFATFVLGDIFLKETHLDFDIIQNFIFSTTQKFYKKPFFLYKEFQIQFPDLWNTYFNDFFKITEFLSIYNLVINIITKFKILTNFSSQQGFIMHLLEIIHNKQKDYHTISSFLEYFNSETEKDFYVTISNTSAINVLTIHKSKGLEFDVVIIPFFELLIEPGFGNKKFFLDFSSNKLRLLRLTKHYLPYSKNLTQIYIKEYKKTFIDKLNNLYVACTRAKNELYIFVPPKSGKEKNKAIILLSDFVNFSEYEQGTKFIFEEKRKDSNTIPIPENELFLKSNFFKEEFVNLEHIFYREKIFKGTVLHNVFSLIGNLYNKDVDEVLEKIFKKMKLLYPTISDWTEIETTTKNVLTKDLLKDYFYIEDGFVEQEKTVVTESGAIKRIDRIIYTKNEIKVVDFKNSKDNFDYYKNQVLEYVSIIKNLFPKKTVSGSIIYFDPVDLDLL